MSVASLALALALAAASQPSTGRVVHVTAARAYLDRGAEHGLAAGQVLPMRRKRARCTVEWVGPKTATCTGNVREGDRFRLGKRPEAAAPPKRLPPPRGKAALAKQRAIVAAAPSPAVADEATAADATLGRRMRASAELAHATWTTLHAPDGAFHEERVDLSIRGAPVAGPFRLFAELTALRRAAPAAARFRPGEETQLYVREAELSAREPGSRFTLSAGRLWPWYAPGAPTMDGAQAGFRTGSGAAEVGAFGGGIPAPDTLAPRAEAWTGGAYWSLRRLDDDGAVPFLRHEGRLAAVQVPGAGRRLEAQGLLHASLGGALDASADVRARLDEPALSAARLDLGGKPHERLRVAGGFRWLDDDAAVADELAPVASRHADASATFEATRWLTMGAAGGYAAELASGDDRSWIGPELGFPRLFGAAGGVTAGYQEELGATAGRAGWLHAIVIPAKRLRLLSRLAYFEDRTGATGEGAPDASREVGVYGAVDARVLDWLSVSGGLLARAGLPTFAGGLESSEVPAGLYGTLSLRGEL